MNFHGRPISKIFSQKGGHWPPGNLGPGFKQEITFSEPSPQEPYRYLSVGNSQCHQTAAINLDSIHLPTFLSTHEQTTTRVKITQ
jgi:hypothetical protein